MGQKTFGGGLNSAGVWSRRGVGGGAAKFGGGFGRGFRRGRRRRRIGCGEGRESRKENY